MSLPSSTNLTEPRNDQRSVVVSDDFVIPFSTQTKWCSEFVFEVHRLSPTEVTEHDIEGHHLLINLGQSVRCGWQTGGRRYESTFPLTGICLQSHGETNASFWQDEMRVAVIAISPKFIKTILSDRTPAAIDTFVEQHCIQDGIAYHHARTLAAELVTPNEPLYAESLCLSLTLHLLTAYSGKAGKPLIPKGKLSAIQLRAAIDLAQTQLGNELTLDQLASAVNISPFRFTRLFKNTTGVSPHQFILRLRLERAKRLLLMRQLSLMEIAQAVGFFDQAHFTNTFRRAFGMTPKAFVQCL
ncbi:MAG: AraC family transcriptional regulator [Cyanobacteriota bacterium]|nr:AraC family transcriptional regulator [Cyanobacteriota bacterium]